MPVGGRHSIARFKYSISSVAIQRSFGSVFLFRVSEGDSARLEGLPGG